jgi:23S rRNA pseudouridine2605 synthase
VHFEDGTEGEHEVKYQRDRGEKRWDPEDSSARNFGRPAHHDPKARKPGEEGAEDRPRKSFGDKPRFGDRPPRGDRPFGNRPPRDGDRKFGDKPKFAGKPGFGNRGRARAAGETDERPARGFTSRTRSARPFEDGGEARPPRKFGDRKPFARTPREDGDRPARTYPAGRKSFDDKPSGSRGGKPIAGKPPAGRPAAGKPGGRPAGDRPRGPKKPRA